AYIWLRYKSEYSLYKLGAVRRDGGASIYKKCPGGPTDGGTYYPLLELPGYPVSSNAWTRISASAVDNADGTVTISLSRDNVLIGQAVDNGIGCPAITGPGAVGVRGDNLDFRLTSLTVDALP